MEEWRSIPSYEGIYEVSSWGRVRSLDRIAHRTWNGIDNSKPVKGKVLVPKMGANGYFFVMLYKEGKYKIERIHRLVAKVFLPNPNNLPCVNHKDETRTNNHVENLEWCTQKYNLNYGTFPERRARLTSRIVEEVKDGKVIATYANRKDAANAVGCSDTAIGDVCLGKQRAVRGRVFRYQK